jgi:hypothetical protein
LVLAAAKVRIPPLVPKCGGCSIGRKRSTHTALDKRTSDTAYFTQAEIRKAA